MAKSIYIHIPFCIKKCAYCSFLSGFGVEFTDVYIEALCKEIKEFYFDKKLNTIYFGGGTPSLLNTIQIEKILSLFNFSSSSEITLEVNPKTVDLKKLKELKSLGINRLSLGVQSFDDNILKIAGRIHSANDAFKTIENIELAGFDNYSMDLMYGLPSQTLTIWQKTLEQAKKLAPPHISLYGLKIEEGSEYFINPPENLPDDDMQADMYEAALETFSDYEHYEFSNFAKSKKTASRHNLTYWNLEEYLGLGVGACGFINNMRYQNECDFMTYIKNPIAKKVFKKTNLLEEYIFLGFRKSEGINTDKINKIFSIDFDKKYSSILQKFQNSGHIQKTLHGYKLTKAGIMLSNYILCEFLDG